MLNIYSDIKSLVYNLNIEQRNRFISFLETLKEDGLNVVIGRGLQRRGETTVDEIIDSINKTTEYENLQKIAEEAASNGKTSIPEDDWGVHESHCCSKHGCKYGDVDCPVALDIIKQDGACYVCWEMRDDNYY